MTAQCFLVELGTEELPPKVLNTIAEAFLAGIEKRLQAAGLKFGAKKSYATPRRLAVLLTQLETQQPDRSINIDGPAHQAAFDAEGNPTQAALGFAKKCGVGLGEIDHSGPKLRFSQIIAGKTTASLLPTIVEDALNDLPVPKRMRWGALKAEFVRPTQWLVMLLGDEVIDCTILAQKSGRNSRGHRFHHPESVRISAPANYVEDLRKAYVLVNLNERRELIYRHVTELARMQEGTAIVPPSLLDEVAALVEWPVSLVCSFEERFLDVPQEALITTMQDNQKYFCILDVDGKLLPRFITVANIESKEPWQVISGNEKVVRPRLTDAEFFFKQDKKQTLESFNMRLQNVVFQARLGSVYDKAVRVSKLAAFITSHIGGNIQYASRAGLLSKCDLATEMVFEFPEMQGIAGYHYALNDGEPEDVALALNEQYMPLSAGAELPSTLTGAAVAIADRLDTLAGIFGIGMLPNGSKDPYALRRAALGILRILIDKKISLDLTEALNFAISVLGPKIKSDGLADQILVFIFDRLRARYEEKGVDVTSYLSVRALNPTSALDFDQRVQAVQAFRQLPEAATLAAVNKRVSNLLSKVEGNISTNVEACYFDNASEFSLFSAIQKADAAVRPMAASRRYNEALKSLSSLREPVDVFFEAVMIKAEDPNVRANRYALLVRLRDLFLSVADISLLG